MKMFFCLFLIGVMANLMILSIPATEAAEFSHPAALDKSLNKQMRKEIVQGIVTHQEWAEASLKYLRDTYSGRLREHNGLLFTGHESVEQELDNSLAAFKVIIRALAPHGLQIPVSTGERCLRETSLNYDKREIVERIFPRNINKDSRINDIMINLESNKCEIERWELLLNELPQSEVRYKATYENLKSIIYSYGIISRKLKYILQPD